DGIRYRNVTGVQTCALPICNCRTCIRKHGSRSTDRVFLTRFKKDYRSKRKLADFDEVMTGFRVGYQCAQGYFGITPDLTCLGKVIGGGLPVGAYGGKREIMERIAP